jgi:hypothetical protein
MELAGRVDLLGEIERVLGDAEDVLNRTLSIARARTTVRRVP